MKKKLTIHFASGLGVACDGWAVHLPSSRDRRKVNCGKCKKTRIYKKGLRKKGHSWNPMGLVHNMMAGIRWISSIT